MYAKLAKPFLALITFFLSISVLSAQPFQRLYAYDPGTGLETGRFNDVTTLPFVASNNVNVVTVGTSGGTTVDGLISYHDPNGVAIWFSEFRHVTGNPVQAEAVSKTPGGDIIACFYDPVANASDIVRTDAFATVMWATRLPGFHVRDVDVDNAPYAGGEGIWLTGQSNNQVAVQGLDAFGNQVFNNGYFVNSPLWNYSGATGFEIQFDPNFNDLVVVGTSNIAGLPLTDMLVMRFTLGGAWMWGRAFSDPTGNDHYHGKALVPHPSNPGHFVISFEYSNIGGTPFDQVGIMEIDPIGNPLWINSYPGVAFFNGTNYLTHGVDTDAGLFLACGSFFPSGAIQSSAYSLAVDIGGNPIQFTEYETTGYWPPNNTTLLGMEFNTLTGHHYMAGNFNSFSSGGGWPMGTNPRSFWMIAADPVGNSLCPTAVVPLQNPLAPAVPNMSHIVFSLPTQVGAPLFWNQVDQMEVNQCTFPKRLETFEAEAAADIEIAYLPTLQRISVTLTGEMNSPGTLQLVDLQGRVLVEMAAHAGQQFMDTQGLAAGIYLVRAAVPGIGNQVTRVLVP